VISARYGLFWKQNRPTGVRPTVFLPARPLAY
jgi:hypothetical protein